MKKVLSGILSVLMLMGMLSTVALAASAPVINIQPQDERIENGENAVYTVEASGEDLTYQWYYIHEDSSSQVPDGSDDHRIEDDDYFLGTGTDTLTVVSVTNGQGDYDCAYTGDRYYCIVSNAAGQVVSDTAKYIVYHTDEDSDEICDFCGDDINAPVITAQPQDATIESGEDAVYTVTATGEDLSYQWYRIPAGEEAVANPEYDEELYDDGYYTGANTPTLTVVSTYTMEDDGTADCEWDGDMYYCVVSNADGEVISDIADYNVEHTNANGDEFCDACINGHPFIDVTSPDEWYYEAAAYCKWNNYFKGDPEGKFNANDAITRAEAVTVISRVLWDLDGFISRMTDAEFEELIADFAVQYGNGEVITLNDVDGTWYERNAVALANLGIITGYEDGSFGGEKLITRQEIAAIMYRVNVFMERDEDIVFGEISPSYNDAANIAAWAAEYVEWARATGLFIGDEQGNLNPTKNCTRAEFAQLILRYDSSMNG